MRTEKNVKVSVPQAAQFLGLSSPGSLYRKIKEGAFEVDSDGKIEQDGLEERWRQVTRPKERHNLPVGERERKRRMERVRPYESAQVPDYNDERARHEKEKRLITELERRKKEGELVVKADIFAAFSAVLNNLTTQAASFGEQIRTDLPHLTDSDVGAIQERLDNMFVAAKESDYEELEEIEE